MVPFSAVEEKLPYAFLIFSLQYDGEYESKTKEELIIRSESPESIIHREELS